MKYLFTAMLLLPASALAQLDPDVFGPVEVEAKSDFSHIRVRKRGNVRTMMFVRDNGDEVGETRLDITTPHKLLTPYTQFMFASYLFQPNVKRVAVVGVGGGAMVHFVAHHQPDVVVDAVEIDPTVLDLAGKYFGLKASDNIHLHAADGLKFLAESEDQYDVIFMDAFLKPSGDTDETGVPLNLKTVEFYKSLHGRLTAGGVVAFNLNATPRSVEDVRMIQSAFEQVYVFRVGKEANYVVVASPAEARLPRSQLATQGRALDRKFRTSFSFARFVGGLVK